MRDTNVVVLTGRLTRDLELRSTAGGTSVTTIRLAVTGQEKEGDDWRDKSMYFDVVAWGRQAEVCVDHLRKGAQVTVTGRLEWREWSDKDGASRQSVEVRAQEVQFGPRPKDDDQAPARASNDLPTDDDLPF